MDQDRRNHSRVPMMVKVVDRDTGEVKEYFSREISIGGVFLETHEDYAVGDQINLQFQIPGTEFDVNVKGKIVHKSTNSDGKSPVGIGIKFEDMDGRSEERIKSYVEKLEKIRQKLSD